MIIFVYNIGDIFLNKLSKKKFLQATQLHPCAFSLFNIIAVETSISVNPIGTYWSLGQKCSICQ